MSSFRSVIRLTNLWTYEHRTASFWKKKMQSASKSQPYIRIHITHLERNNSISFSLYPKDVSTSSVCWPNNGGSLRILLLLFLNVTAGPTIFSFTSYEQSTFCTIPILLTCSLSKAWKTKIEILRSWYLILFYTHVCPSSFC